MRTKGLCHVAFLERQLIFDVALPYDEVRARLAKAIVGGAWGSVRFASADQFYGRLAGSSFDLELTDGSRAKGPMPAVAGRLVAVSHQRTRVEAKVLLDEATGWWAATFGLVILAGVIWVAVAIPISLLLRVAIIVGGVCATLVPWAMFTWHWRRTERLLRQTVGAPGLPNADSPEQDSSSAAV